jgi:hypothetical protein
MSDRGTTKPRPPLNEAAPVPVRYRRCAENLFNLLDAFIIAQAGQMSN